MQCRLCNYFHHRRLWRLFACSGWQKEPILQHQFFIMFTARTGWSIAIYWKGKITFWERKALQLFKFALGMDRVVCSIAAKHAATQELEIFLFFFKKRNSFLLRWEEAEGLEEAGFWDLESNTKYTENWDFLYILSGETSQATELFWWDSHSLRGRHTELALYTCPLPDISLFCHRKKNWQWGCGHWAGRDQKKNVNIYRLTVWLPSLFCNPPFYGREFAPQILSTWWYVLTIIDLGKYWFFIYWSNVFYYWSFSSVLSKLLNTRFSRFTFLIAQQFPLTPRTYTPIHTCK